MSFLSPIKVYERTTLSTPEEKYAAWPSITNAKKEGVFVVYSGGRERHVDPFGKIFLTKQLLNGKWSPPEVLQDSPLDDRDPGILSMENGTMILSYFTSDYFYKKFDTLKKDYGSSIETTWKEALEKAPSLQPASYLRRSTNGGRTWSEPQQVLVTSPHGPIEASNHSLYYLGNHLETRALTLLQSEDEGKTWITVKELFPEDVVPSVHLCEPSLVELTPGFFVAWFRANGKRNDRYLYKSISQDGGHTWSDPVKTSIWGYPPHIMRHSSGNLLLTYGYRFWPYRVKVAISKDEGETFSKGITLAKSVDTDFGYPQTTEMNDETLCTVYYKKDKKKSFAKVEIVRWELSTLRF